MGTDVVNQESLPSADSTPLPPPLFLFPYPPLLLNLSCPPLHLHLPHLFLRVSSPLSHSLDSLSDIGAPRALRMRGARPRSCWGKGHKAGGLFKYCCGNKVYLSKESHLKKSSLQEKLMSQLSLEPIERLCIIARTSQISISDHR